MPEECKFPSLPTDTQLHYIANDPWRHGCDGMGFGEARLCQVPEGSEEQKKGRKLVVKSSALPQRLNPRG